MRNMLFALRPLLSSIFTGVFAKMPGFGGEDQASPLPPLLTLIWGMFNHSVSYLLAWLTDAARRNFTVKISCLSGTRVVVRRNATTHWKRSGKNSVQPHESSFNLKAFFNPGTWKFSFQLHCLFLVLCHGLVCLLNQKWCPKAFQQLVWQDHK